MFDIRDAIREAEFGVKEKAKVTIDLFLTEAIGGKDTPDLLEGYEEISQMKVTDDKYWYKVGAFCSGIEDYWSTIFALEYSLEKGEDNDNLALVYKAIIKTKLLLGLYKQASQTSFEAIKALLKEAGFENGFNPLELADNYCDGFEYSVEKPELVEELTYFLYIYEHYKSPIIEIDLRRKKYFIDS